MSEVEAIPLREPPLKFKDLGTVYSNFDQETDVEVVGKLQHGDKGIAIHAAWDFCGYVWHENGWFIETVMRYHTSIATFTCKDIGPLLTKVNEEFGYD